MKRQYPALRGLAILLVVLNHSITFGTSIPEELGYPTATGLLGYIYLALKQLGWFAVPTFLFLSGCFFVYAARGQGQRVLYKTVVASLKNVLWPYLIWSIISYIVVYFSLDQRYTPIEYLKFLLTGYPYHFIPLLVFYYIISPILILVGKRYPWLVLGVIGVYQLILLNITVPGALGFNSPGWTGMLALPIIRSTMATWGIFFPLGVIYSLHDQSMLRVSQRGRWVFGLAATLFYSLGVLHEVGVFHFPLAGYLAPVAFVMLVPIIKRESIPWARQFEKIGKRAYGLYLSHLVTIFIVLWAIKYAVPGLFYYPLVLIPLLYALAVSLPLLLMSGFERLPIKRAYRYLFG